MMVAVEAMEARRGASEILPIGCSVSRVNSVPTRSQGASRVPVASCRAGRVVFQFPTRL